MTFTIIYPEPDEFAELRYAAELLETFIASASPRVVSQPVIEAAKIELAIIYGEIEPYTFLPY